MGGKHWVFGRFWKRHTFRRLKQIPNTILQTKDQKITGVQPFRSLELNALEHGLVRWLEAGEL